MAKARSGIFNDAKCLHEKNGLNMTIGDYLGMTVGEKRRTVTRLSWTSWQIRGEVVGLFEAYKWGGSQ